MATCSENDATLSVSINIYTASDCSGFATPHTLDSVPAGCHNGTMLSCQKNPTAIDEGWPAIGLYVQDTTCSTPTALVAINPGCNDNEMLGYSTEVSCTDTSFSLSGYNTSTCSGIPTTSHEVQLDTCEQLSPSSDIPELMEQGPLWDMFEELMSAGLITLNQSDFYYYADCAGAEKLPGVETNNADTSGHNNDDQYSGLGIVGLSLIIAASVLAVVCCMCGVKHIIFGKKNGNDDFSENILPVGA